MTALDITILPAAIRSMDEQAAYYVRVSESDLHFRWRSAIDRALSSLMLAPEGGVLLRLPNPATSHLRRWPIPKFPNHLLIYSYDASARHLTLVDVVHGARDLPRYLQTI